MKTRAVLAGAAALFALSAVAYAQTDAPDRRGGMFERLMAADANGDGSITAAEAAAAREQAFARIDADGDGYITEAERQARRTAQGQRGARRGPQDADNDGRISRTEFLSGGTPGFDRIDTNNNDVLEPAELEAARTMMEQRRHRRPQNSE